LKMFETRVVRRAFVPKRDELTGGCFSEALYNLYPLLHIIVVIKSRRTK
jgi:hypothetical protein